METGSHWDGIARREPDDFTTPATGVTQGGAIVESPRDLASDARAAEVERVVQQASHWAATRPDIRALLLVGSWARRAARSDSDVDLVVLTTTPDFYTPDGAWTRELDAVEISRVQQWGSIAERRLVLPSGLEVEIDIGPLSWAQADPVDTGTRRVVTDGCRILYDPDDHLQRLIVACGIHGPS